MLFTNDSWFWQVIDKIAVLTLKLFNGPVSQFGELVLVILIDRKISKFFRILFKVV